MAERPVLFVTAEPGLDGIPGDIGEGPSEMFLIADRSVEIFLSPEPSLLMEQPVDAVGRKRFPGMDDGGERPIWPRCYDDVDMIRHNNPPVEMIPFFIEMEEGLFDDTSDLRST
nr:hypothetical protein [Aminithiophilus ramosus]